MTSLNFFNSPCPTTILCSMTKFTNKAMAVRWAVLSAPLWPIFAWRRSKSPQSVIHPFPPKFRKGTLTIVFASLEKTTSQPSMIHKIQLTQTSRLPSRPNATGRSPFSTLWSPVEMESSLLMFIGSPPIQTDILIPNTNFNSQHDSQHKVSTASTLLHRALNLPNFSEGKKRELNYVHAALVSNGYPSKFISNIQAKKLDPQQQMYPQRNLLECFSRWLNQPSHTSFASLPYIKGVTEPLTRGLKKHDVTVINKPFTTLQQQFPAPKFRPSTESQTNVVYKIPCTNCWWYIILGKLAEL